MSNRPRIVIAEDTKEWSEALISQLPASQYNILACVKNGGAAIEACKTLFPDVLILDLIMPIKTGFEVLGELKLRMNTPIKILAFSSDEGLEKIAMAQLADKFLGKFCDPAKLRQAIEELTSTSSSTTSSITAIKSVKVGHDDLVSPDLDRRIEGEGKEENIRYSDYEYEKLDQSLKPLDPECPLTARELEILRLAGTGGSYEEIGLTLAITKTTVNAHFQSIFNKLDPLNKRRKKTDVLKIAQEHGWI